MNQTNQAKPIFKVDIQETKKFANIWNYKGLVVPMDDVHHQFATDYANVVLNNFITLCQQRTQQKPKETAIQPNEQVVNGKTLIVEGIND